MKPKLPIKQVKELFEGPDCDYEKLETLVVSAGEPSADLYSFKGTLNMTGMDS